MGKVRALLLAGGFLGICLLLVPLQWGVLKAGWISPDRLPQCFHRWLCALMGLRIRVIGEPAPRPGTLLIANHASYLDIPIIGAVHPVVFVAKRQVASWPLFGVLARLQRSIFVDRESRQRAQSDILEIERRLAAGDTVVLFPEGTSSDGNRVLAFKSALMAAVKRDDGGEGEAGAIMVQPLTVAYTRLHGIPLGRDWRHKVAWYGDMDLVPHLLGVFAAGPIDVELTFHPPVSVEGFLSRKALAAHCHADVAAGLAASLSGRPLAISPVEARAGAGSAPKDAAAPAPGLAAKA